MVVLGSWQAIIAPNPEFTPCESDTLKNSNDTECSTQSETYVKLKEIKVNEAYDGNMRIKFDLKSSETGYIARGKLYKNGEVLGEEQINSSKTYETKSWDFSLTLAANDLLQLYGKQSDGDYYAFVKNMRLCYGQKLIKFAGHAVESDDIVVDKPAISTTNQDP